jgi:hypothetical protein
MLKQRSLWKHVDEAVVSLTAWVLYQRSLWQQRCWTSGLSDSTNAELGISVSINAELVVSLTALMLNQQSLWQHRCWISGLSDSTVAESAVSPTAWMLSQRCLWQHWYKIRGLTAHGTDKLRQHRIKPLNFNDYCLLQKNTFLYLNNIFYSDKDANTVESNKQN